MSFLCILKSVKLMSRDMSPLDLLKHVIRHKTAKASHHFTQNGEIHI